MQIAGVKESISGCASQEVHVEATHPSSVPQGSSTRCNSLSGTLQTPLITDAASDPSISGCASQELLVEAAHPSFAPQSSFPKYNLLPDTLQIPLITDEAMDRVDGIMSCNTFPSLSHRNSVHEKRSRVEWLFPSIEGLKTRIDDSLEHFEYKVEDLYHKAGFAKSVVTNEFFKNFITAVTLANIIWLGFETDHNKADLLCQASLIFQIGDNLFCLIFSFEIAARFLAFKCKYDAFTNGSFVLDGSLALLMVWETWIIVALYLLFGSIGNGNTARGSRMLRILRLVRLVRVARTAKMVERFPVLMTLIRAMAQGFRAVLAVGGLLSLVVYVFALIFTMSLSGEAVFNGKFDTVPVSMKLLFLQVICGPDSSLMNSLVDTSFVCLAVFILFLMCANFTLMNMLIGVVCDAVCRVSTEAKQDLFERMVNQTIHGLEKTLDVDNSGGISLEEFAAILTDPATTECFYDIGVDLLGVANFARFIYAQCDEMSYQEFSSLIRAFRKTEPATIKDIMESMRYISLEVSAFEAQMFTLVNGAAARS
jgi:hypothetical protein